MAQHNLDGAAAEGIAAKHLQSLGYKIVERNFRNRYCEIDIIARRKSDLVFSEVKYRRNSSHGGAVAAVDTRKMQQLEFAAQLWLAEHPLFEPYAKRVDVITIEGSLLQPQVKLFENAVMT